MWRPFQNAIAFKGREWRKGKSKYRFLKIAKQFQMPLNFTAPDEPAFTEVEEAERPGPDMKGPLRKIGRQWSLRVLGRPAFAFEKGRSSRPWRPRLIKLPLCLGKLTDEENLWGGSFIGIPEDLAMTEFCEPRTLEEVPNLLKTESLGASKFPGTRGSNLRRWIGIAFAPDNGGSLTILANEIFFLALNKPPISIFLLKK
jgi:hypothetical protein